MRISASFVGSFERTVDAQGRIKLPTEIRDALDPQAENTFVITRWLDGCLAAHPLNHWQQIGSALRGSEHRNLVRAIAAQAVMTKVDPQGRITVPARLLATVGIDGPVLLVGTLDRLELWNPDRFAETVEDVESDFDEAVGVLARLAEDAGGDGDTDGG